MSRGEELDQLELRVVGVLELVHEDVAEALLTALQDVRAGAEEPQGEDDLVAEVHLPAPRHERLVLRVRPGQLQVLPGLEARPLVARPRPQRLRVRQVLLRAHVLVLEPADLAENGLQVARGVAQRAVVLERELEQVVAEEDHLLGAGEHAEVGREPQLQRVLLDQPVAEGVEGGELHVGVTVGDERVHPLLHLDGGLVGEGEGEDLGGAGAPGRDQVGDPPGDDGGLARAGAGDDEQRARLVSDRRRLALGQALEDPLGAARGLRHPGRNYTIRARSARAPPAHTRTSSEDGREARRRPAPTSGRRAP